MCLKTYCCGDAKILAVGNPLKRDDGIALEVADRIPFFDIIRAGTAPENYIKPGDKIIIIDAVDFGGRPGQVRLFLPGDMKTGSASTHSAEKVLFEIADVKIIGIQPKDTGDGEGISRGISIGKVAERVEQYLIDLSRL